MNHDYAVQLPEQSESDYNPDFLGLNKKSMAKSKNSWLSKYIEFSNQNKKEKEREKGQNQGEEISGNNKKEDPRKSSNRQINYNSIKAIYQDEEEEQDDRLSKYIKGDPNAPDLPKFLNGFRKSINA